MADNDEVPSLDYAKIEILITRTVPEEARRKGGDVLRSCLVNLWDMALRIGLNYGEDNIARSREEGYRDGREAGLAEGLASGEANAKAVIAWEAANTAAATSAQHKKELEEERVWGFDVGWRLAVEENAPKASEIPAFTPLLPSVSTIATQTDPPPPTSAPSKSSAGITPTVLNPPRSPLPPPAPGGISAPCTDPVLAQRDFSSLCTGAPSPFASLQRRVRRSRRSPTHPSSRTCQSHGQNFLVQNNPARSDPSRQIHRRHRSARPTSHHPQASLPSPFSSPSSASTQPLDWAHDLRLRDLGRALTSLGWIRPG